MDQKKFPTYFIANLVVDEDVDDDGILNKDDLDDDNDGILDEDEGEANARKYYKICSASCHK